MLPSVSWLFCDLNSYFASVEQELQPELRGQPIVVVPVRAETTCCIAVSYQAKAYGIQTGTLVSAARALCPHLMVVDARPRLYVEMHHRIVEAIERCVPVQQVMSCDEFACQLIGRERELRRAVEIAYEIKRELRKVGPTLRCSIGLGPNRLLAKIAGEVQKPDGLMVFERQNLPSALYCLDLADIPGVGRRMEKRIRAAGVGSVRELCGLSRKRMNAVWGSVWGDRLWLWLRGEDFLEPEARPLQTLSRQHIVPPDSRNRETVRGIVIKLLLSTARKMRRFDLWASGIFLQIGFQEGRSCEIGIQISPTQDAFTLQSHMILLYDRTPPLTPSDVSVALTGLGPAPRQADLFAREIPDAAQRATEVVDNLNLRFGLNTVYPGSIHAVRKEAPTRIPFGPPPPLEEFDDPADSVRPMRNNVRRDQGVRERYKRQGFVAVQSGPSVDE